MCELVCLSSSNVLNDRSHPANVIGNVGKIRSDLCAVGKNSSHDTCTLKMNSKALNPTLPERCYIHDKFSISLSFSSKAKISSSGIRKGGSDHFVLLKL